MNTEKRRESGTRVTAGTFGRDGQGACIAGVSRRSLVMSVLSYVLLIVIGLSTPSCIWEWGDLFGSKKKDGNWSIDFQLRLPSSFTSRAALSSQDENYLADVWVLAFSEGSAGELKFRLAADELSHDVNTGIVTARVLLDPSLVKSSDERYDVWVFANVPASKVALSLGTSKEAALSSLSYSESDGVTQTTDAFVPIPLWGVLSGATFRASGLLAEKSTVDLIRSVAKIDFQLSAANAENVVLEHLYYFNRRTSGVLVSSYLSDDGKSVTAPTLPEVGSKGRGELVYDAAPDTVTTIYSFEAAGVVGELEYAVEEPCLVFGARYNDGEETYYRVDFTRLSKNGELNESASNPILRDSWYRVVVDDPIVRDGASTPELALEDNPLSARVNVVQWTTDNINVILK